VQELEVLIKYYLSIIKIKLYVFILDLTRDIKHMNSRVLKAPISSIVNDNKYNNLLFKIN
jgi:hypothetical protein